MSRRLVTRKRLLQLLALLVAIGIAFVLSLGNYEVGNPTTPSSATAPAATTSAAP
ncbi:MAG: hypothetical protein ACRDMX_01635 [Solirubrobacteraceae bacterium]